MTDDDKVETLQVLRAFTSSTVAAQNPTADPVALLAVHDRLMVSWREAGDDEALVVACGLALLAKWVTLAPEQRATSAMLDRAMLVLQAVSVNG